MAKRSSPTPTTTDSEGAPAEAKRQKRRNVLRVQVSPKLIALAALSGEAPEDMAARLLEKQVEIAVSALQATAPQV